MKALIILLILTLFSLSSVRANVIIDLEISTDYISVKPGEEIYANLIVYRIGGVYDREDYLLKLHIIDENGNKISEKFKEIALEKEVNTAISFNLPQDIKPGIYRMEVVFDGKKSGSDFVVTMNGEKKVKEIFDIPIYFTLLVLFIFIIFSFFYYRKINKEIKNKHAVDMEDLLK